MNVAAQLHAALKDLGLAGNLRTYEDVDEAYRLFCEKVGITYDERKTTFKDMLDAYAAMQQRYPQPIA